MSTDTPTPRKPPRRDPLPGKQKITREKYDALVVAFRTHGENYKAVAAECHVHWGTAKKAYVEGWAHQKSKPWALAIRDVLKREQVEARAALAREKNNLVQDHRIARQESLRAAIDAGFADLVDSRAKQGKVIRAARDNSIAALIVSQKLLKAAVPLADKVVHDLDDPALDVFQRMRLMRQLGRFAHDSIEMAQVVEEMERRALGEPDTILEVSGGVTMTVDEARATLKEVGEVLQMYEDGDVEEVIEAEWSDNDQLAVPSGKAETEPAEDADAPEETSRSD
jgi:hypothetical protein